MADNRETETVYLLWYERQRSEGEDTELLIGVYKTEADAAIAAAELKVKAGFAEYPEGFQICPYILGDGSWQEGYIRVDGQFDLPIWMIDRIPSGDTEPTSS